ncbi:hypothetical protein [Peribacillus alkalitolerans]|uniref:hypothetical protein n=1 Tax=Peribacillus alkalitolerans TaxID=1550385 RepID=UPI0013D25898|nr:hypothetical protein [Peribacillus alkalitolerans]
MMRKENYQTSGSVVIKRSPAVNGRKINKPMERVSNLPASLVVGTGKSNLHKSVSQNIISLGRVLKESDKIMPRAKFQTNN